MTCRLYRIREASFNEKILPKIKKYTTPLGGWPPKLSHYVCFNAIALYAESMPWRDCPKKYGPWHTIYTRFNRWSQNRPLWNILYELKEKKLIEMDIIFMDSTTIKLHKQGSGAKKKSGDQNIGKNLAGVGTKIHVIMGRENPICVQITGAWLR